MESGTNLNKGEGLAGKSKADDFRAFMHKSQTKTRRAIGELQNPNASFEASKTHEGSVPDVDHVRAPSMVGDNVRVSTFAGRSSSSQNHPHKNVTDNFTSLGETTNPSLSMMNPSKDHYMVAEYPKPVESLWSVGDASFVITDDVPSPNMINEDLGINLGSSVNLVEKTSNPSHDSAIVQSVEINTIPKSYAGAAGAAIKDQTNVSLRFENTLYGYFSGKRMAFPVVEYYVKNNWAKYGLKRIMLNAKGFFFFKFDSRASLDAVLEGGPWMVHNSPIILKKWSMKTSLQKEELTHIPIWLKLHDVPIQVFEEDGISLIATYLGKPIMLDSYTSSMCKDSWGRSSFARCLIKINLEADFMESITIGIPDLDGPVVNDTNVTNDGFQKVVNRKRNNKGSSAGNKLPKGVPVSKGFQVGKEFAYQPKASNVGSNGNTGTRSETSSKAGPSKNTNNDASLITKGTNTRQQDTGSRIILGWNDDLVDVMIMAQTNPVMHVQVNTWADHKTLFCSFVYANNYYIDHCVLWSNLVGHAGLMRNRPWVLLGDFNVALNLEDHSAGGYELNAAMCEFKECVQTMKVADVNSIGLHFTWNQKPKGSNGILKKIDWIMVNLQFNDDFPGSFAIFQPVNVEGCAMFRVVKRLKGLKSSFRKLLHNHGNLHERVNNIQIELDEAQKAINRDPSSYILHEEHTHYLLAFKEAQLDEERFLKQKAKIKWLKTGDSNTAYFHKIVKSKCARNRIEMVSDASNNLNDGNQVPGAFVNHYNQFLRVEGVTIPLDDHDLFTHVLDDAKADFVVRDVSNDEVKSFIFFMRDDRAPGPDGFTAAFFKKAWDVVGGDITYDVQDFFFNSKLLKELNHTIISLIPKVTTHARINDYRPISCCNVLYKCISKIIANRVKEGLGDIVSINQFTNKNPTYNRIK
ncbi:sodium/hydrogen exchanger 6 [Tanacetum coccineum]